MRIARVLIVLIALAAVGWRVQTAPMVFVGEGGKYACHGMSVSRHNACIPDNGTVLLHSALIAGAAFGLYHAIGKSRRDAAEPAR